MNRHLLAAVLVVTTVAPRASEATQFTVAFRNVTIERWSEGLASLQPLWTWGARSPQPGSPEYATYAFVASTCDLSDAFCGAGCDDDGNAPVLAARWGLTLGVNAWVIPPLPGARQTGASSYAGCATDADCGGRGATCGPAPTPISGTTWSGGACQWELTFDAAPGQRLSYLAKVTSTAGAYDFVAATEFNTPTSLGVPLFAATGPDAPYPLARVAFSQIGFAFDRIDPTGGLSGSCQGTLTNVCPLTPIDACFAGPRPRTTDLVIPSHSLTQPLTAQWRYVTPMVNGRRATTDGVAFGELQPAGGIEVLAVTNGGNYVTEPFTVAPGRAVVLLQSNGAERDGFTPATGHDLLGFPTVERLAGTNATCAANGAGCQYLVGEIGDVAPPPPDVGAGVLARNFNPFTATWGTSWQSRPFGFPGYWNMGQSSGDVRPDLTLPGPVPNEVVAADLYGNVAVLRADTGAGVNNYSLYTSQSHETLFGHAAIADVDGIAGNEIVVFGARTGRVFALKAPAANGPLQLAWTSDALPSGGRAFANGPAVGDIDGDGRPEIVVVSGLLNQVFAFDPTYGTGCKYRWPVLSGNGYYYTSPVLGDVTGDGRREVVVFSNDSILSVLAAPTTAGNGCTDGTVVWEYNVGNPHDNAWFTPALAQLTGTAKLDVVAAGYHTFEVIDVDRRRMEYRFTDGTATFYPSVAIQPGSGALGTPGAFLYVSGWQNGTVYRLTTPNNTIVPTTTWPTFMGNNQRTGAL